MYVVVSRLCGAGDGTQLKREANSVNNKLKIRVTIISKLVTYATGLVTLTILFSCLIFTLTVIRGLHLSRSEQVIKYLGVK